LASFELDLHGLDLSVETLNFRALSLRLLLSLVLLREFHHIISRAHIVGDEECNMALIVLLEEYTRVLGLKLVSKVTIIARGRQ